MGSPLGRRRYYSRNIPLLCIYACCTYTSKNSVEVVRKDVRRHAKSNAKRALSRKGVRPSVWNENLPPVSSTLMSVHACQGKNFVCQGRGESAFKIVASLVVEGRWRVIRQRCCLSRGESTLSPDVFGGGEVEGGIPIHSSAVYGAQCWGLTPLGCNR